MATALFVLLWWTALFGWWLVLVGTNSGLELIAAACAAFVAALLAVGLRRRRLLRYRVEAGVLLKLLKVPWKILRENVLVFWALALHIVGLRRVNSRYRAFEFPTGGPDALSAGRRALAGEGDGLSPNTLPVDMDCERGVVLRHELDARRTSDDLP